MYPFLFWEKGWNQFSAPFPDKNIIFEGTPVFGTFSPLFPEKGQGRDTRKVFRRKTAPFLRDRYGHKFSNLVSLPCPFSKKRGEKEGFPEENLCPFKNVVFVRTQVFGTCPKEKEGTQVFGTCPVEKEGTQVFLRKTLYLFKNTIFVRKTKSLYLFKNTIFVRKTFGKPSYTCFFYLFFVFDYFI